MHDLENRLIQCFGAVFPNRSREEIVAATHESFSEWDSLAGVTLLTVLQQEFKLDLDFGDLEELGSFQSTLSYLAKSGAGDRPHGV